jgi:thymidylate synthase (FAD)
VPHVFREGLDDFLSGFDASLEFNGYLFDDGILDDVDVKEGDEAFITDAEKLAKIAGQLCYMSFGPGHTPDERAKGYFENILSSGHGSLLEHANFSLLCYGISRSLTHELVRHRAGFGYSQVSQRYVDGKTLRFVERPEYQNHASLHLWFETRIDDLTKLYDDTAQMLMSSMANELAHLPRTDRRKRVNQAARSVLPNETEAPIVVTGNVRAWRHFLVQRGSKHAEVEIRALAVKAFQILNYRAPLLFQDFSIVDLEDGTKGLSAKYAKV